MWSVSAFYKFVAIEDVRDLQATLKALCAKNGVIGTILVAPEGINGTIAGQDGSLENVMATIRSDNRFANLQSKESFAEEKPFGKLRIRLKKEIISIRDPLADPTIHVGTYVEPRDWNELIQDPDVLLIDTRNDYEVSEGTFKNAVDPNLKTFGEFPEYVDSHLNPVETKRVAMFCTGGIRCEKASALLLSKGFEQVYHLQGGILKYLEDVPEGESLFEGKCFVFDGREVVDKHDIVK